MKMDKKHNMLKQKRHIEKRIIQDTTNKIIDKTTKIEITNMNYNFNRKIVISLSLVLVFIFIVTVSSSYAFFTTSIKGKEFVIYTGNLAVNYEKKTNVINVDNAYPMTNTEGLTTTSHEFMVTNNGSVDARYQIRLELDESLKDMIDIRYIKMSYQVNGGDYSTPVLLSDLNSSLVFVKDVILNPTESNTYGIKLWIDLSAPNDIQGKTFKARIVVDSIQNVDNGYVVDTTPIIYLNKDNSGNQDIYLKTNDTYTELGVEKVEDDQEIFTPSQVSLSYEYYDGTNLSTVQSIDTSKNGIYYITYSITDKSGNTGKRVRIVTINPTDTIPTITLNGDVTITQEETEVYTELGVTVASDNQVVIIGEVKTSTIGTYIIRYIVVDSNGNLNSVVRTVNIIGATTLYSKILAQNTLIEAEPTLTTTSVESGDASGLYKSIATNSGNPTYYFRGNIENNYVLFAGFTWRIVRINEDGTIRMIMQNGINSTPSYDFNSSNNNKTYMYYSNSNAKALLETWYTNNIASNENYANKVATGDYFCEQAKVAYNSTYVSNSGASMTVYSSYEPNFKCENDENGKGLINTNIGLINYDEVVYAGGYYYKNNSDFYLYNNTYYWTMSPEGFDGYNAGVWLVHSPGFIDFNSAIIPHHLRPVLNLKSDTKAIGNGTTDSYYEIVY